MKTKMSKLKFRFPHLTKKQVILVSLIGLVLLLGLIHTLYQYLNKVTAPMQPVIRVQTVSVKEASMPDSIETIGSLTAEQELKIKSGGVGRITSIEVESGSWVNAGTLLIKIIAAPEVRAPFDGYLTDWLVKPGEYVQSGTELIDIVNTNVLKLVYRIPEQYASKLSNEQTVEVFVKTHPDKTFTGKVFFIAPVVDKKTYTILVKAEVPNPDQDLWPGMSAHVRHVFSFNPKAKVIPESALILTLEGYEVWVVKDGVIQRKTVQLGSRREGRVEILSGVDLGESVIMTRTPATKEGAKVEKEDWLGEW